MISIAQGLVTFSLYFIELTQVTDKTIKTLLASFALSLWNAVVSDEYFTTKRSNKLLDSLMVYLTFRQEALKNIQVGA